MTDQPTTPADPSQLAGLTTSEVEERIAAGKVNVNTELKTKSVRQLVLENVCTLFNLINVVLAVLVIITGELKNLTFLVIVLANTFIGIWQALRSKRMVDRLTLLAQKKARVIRNSEEVELELDQIVLDDLVRLGRGDQIPADAIVVKGEASVNESLLTGESDLIRKVAGDELMSGSFVDSGLVYARVEHVGADNYVAKINNEAKYVKKVNSEIMRALNAIVRFASVVMLPLGIGLYLASRADGVGFSASVLTTVGALLGMIPQGLVLLTSSVLCLATIRLARKKVLAQQLYCIETLARVDVLCLDKTGTITSGRMEVAGTHPLEGEGAAELDQVLASIAQATSDDANETCRALLDYFGLGLPAQPAVEKGARRAKGAAAPAPEAPRVSPWEPVRVVPFSSAKKWSGAYFGEQGAFVMGAAQFVLEPQDFEACEKRVSELAAQARALVVARVEGFTAEGDLLGRPVPLGFVTIRDEIRTSAPETIRYFCEQGVTLNVISGDDPRTVSFIAAQVGIPGADKYVDATTLTTPAKIDAAAERYHVFGRVTPQQKRELVQALQRRGHTVAMTGDGVNDVLALKEADCSVAMAAGSDAARNVAEIVLVDNDFAAMPAVVAEGRRSINNLQRSAALFLTKTLFSMALAAICIFFPPYPFQPIQMTLINFFCIGLPSFVLALEPNHDRVKGNFLTNVLKRALPASLMVVAAVGVCMVASGLLHTGSAALSTMSLVATSVVGCRLIWQLSWPFTPLRTALFAFIAVGIVVGVGFFPELFIIAWPALPGLAVLALACLVGWFGFGWLTSALERFAYAFSRVSRRQATGLGRGVSVSMSRGRKGALSVRPSAVERVASRTVARAREKRDRREQRAAQKSAQAAVLQAKRAEAASGSARSKRGFTVSKSSHGVQVKLPRRKR